MSQPTRCHQCQWGTADIPDVVLCSLHAQAGALRDKLTDLSHLAAVLNDRQHAGLTLTGAMWGQLYQHVNEARALLKAMSQPTPGPCNCDFYHTARFCPVHKKGTR